MDERGYKIWLIRYYNDFFKACNPKGYPLYYVDLLQPGTYLNGITVSLHSGNQLKIVLCRIEKSLGNIAISTQFPSVPQCSPKGNCRNGKQ